MFQRGDIVRHRPPVPYPAQGVGKVRDVDPHIRRGNACYLTVDFGRFKFACFESDVVEDTMEKPIGEWIGRAQYPVLDHGYVKLIDTWGSDERIVEAARMSTAKGFKGWGSPEAPGDEKFLRFLYENKHATPFEMAGMQIEVQAPIVVFREWHRHRTQSYNEMSGRYTVLPELYYIPSRTRCREAKQSKKNKQSSEGGFSLREANQIRETLEVAYRHSRECYDNMIAQGVAREVARLCLPVAQYSRMRAQANLRNWLAFLTLRMAPAAQWEIRQYANVVGSIVAENFPFTWKLFAETTD